MSENESNRTTIIYSKLLDQLEAESKLRVIIINYFIFFVGPENPLYIRLYALILLLISLVILIVFSTMILHLGSALFTRQEVFVLQYIICIIGLALLAFIPGIILMLKTYSVEQASRLNANFKKVYKFHQEKLNNSV